MYENMTYELLLQRMLGRVSDKMDKRESSLIWDTHSSTAAELMLLYIEMESIIANSYGDTADREYLILLCKDRGIMPKPATHAVLKGEFTPENIDVTGKRFNIGDINYTVLEQIVPGQYQVRCETEGAVGNRYLGDMIPIDYIDGLQTARLTEILIPGEDKEDTEILRKRYFDSFYAQAFGGNRADYLSKVRGINGVGDVKVTRIWNSDISPADMIPSEKVSEWYREVIKGLDEEAAAWLSAVYTAAHEKKLTVGGTVLITVVNSMDFGEASETLLNNIQTVLDPEQNAGEGYGLAPIGHVVNVKSASPVNVTVKTTLTFEQGYGWLNLQNTIREAIEDYLLELRKEWAENSMTVVRISQIESRILAVKGVADIENTSLNGNKGNLTLGEYEIPVMGGVSE